MIYVHMYVPFRHCGQELLFSMYWAREKEIYGSAHFMTCKSNNCLQFRMINKTRIETIHDN